MAGNPTIIATISAEDKTKAAIQTATAALRELNKSMKSIGDEKIPDGMLKGLDREIGNATKRMNELRERTAGVKHEVAGLRGAFAEALAGLKPLAEMAVGFKLVHAGEQTIHKAGEYAHAEILNAYAGMTPEQIERAKAATLEAQKLYPNLSLTSGQHLAGSMYSVMADNHEAEELFPTIMKYRAAMRAKHTDESEEQIDERVHNTLKFAEAMGANVNAKTMSALLDKVQRVENFEGRMIRPEDLLGLSKQAGANLKMLTDQGQKTAIQLVAEWGGDRTGTFLQALGKYAAGSGFDNHASALNELVDAGLVDRKDLKLNKQGNPVGIVSGSASYNRMQSISADPLAFVKDTLDPALEKKWAGMSEAQRKAAEETFRKNYAKEIEADPSMAMKDAAGHEIDTSKLDAKMLYKLQEIRRMFPNAVAARGLGEIFIQKDQLSAKMGKIDQAEGIDQTLETAKKDPVAQLGAFQTAVGNFATLLGGPLMEPAASGLNAIAQGIGSLNTAVAQFNKDHPNLAPYTSGAAVGGMLAAGGALLGGGALGAVKVFKAIGNLFGGGGGEPAAPAEAVPETAAPEGAPEVKAPAEAAPEVKAPQVAEAAPATPEVKVPQAAPELGAGGFMGGFANIMAFMFTKSAEQAFKGFNEAGVGKEGHREMGWGRFLENIITGQDPMPSADEMKAELDRRIRARAAGSPPGETQVGPPAGNTSAPNGGMPALERSIKVEAEGTVAGEMTVMNEIVVHPSPELLADIRRAKEPMKVPITGNLGTSMGGTTGAVRDDHRGRGDL